MPGRRQAVLDKVKAKHPKIHTIQSDVADPAQIAALAARVKAEFPRLDVLMNNAGIMLYKNLKAPAARSKILPDGSPTYCSSLREEFGYQLDESSGDQICPKELTAYALRG